MEEMEKHVIEHLIPDYFSGEISEENKQSVERWKNSAEANQELFDELLAVWESGGLLELMGQFSSGEAIKKVHRRIGFHEKTLFTWQNLQRIAAVLLLPVIIYAGFLTFYRLEGTDLVSEVSPRHKITTPAGTVSEIVLPDGTKVWLNSKTKLEFPLSFGNTREVSLVGEAYFEVKKDQKHPFVVNTGTINVEVLGTAFNVTNYPDENQTEIVLASGEVQLYSGKYQKKKSVGYLSPSQRAVYDEATNEMRINTVTVEKYTAWKDGVLMFVDDPMDEVIKKLSRWFNTEFVLEGVELDDYVYRATFRDESLTQVLELLKISAPIAYTVEPGKLLSNGSYTREKIIIRKR
jgi:ferric-dicitrate binding protein FerR (iron transport regulator)